jgi:hypothetical protein
MNRSVSGSASAGVVVPHAGMPQPPLNPRRLVPESGVLQREGFGFTFEWGHHMSGGLMFTYRHVAPYGGDGAEWAERAYVQRGIAHAVNCVPEPDRAQGCARGSHAFLFREDAYAASRLEDVEMPPRRFCYDTVRIRPIHLYHEFKAVEIYEFAYRHGSKAVRDGLAPPFDDLRASLDWIEQLSLDHDEDAL